MRKIFFMAGASVIMAGLIWTASFLWTISTASSTPDLKAADVGIVLGASMWGDSPSPGLQERLEEALRQYKSGKVNKLILTGGLDDPTFKYTEAQGMQQYLLDRGIPAADILLENKATSTYENLLYSRSIMEDHGWATAIIITHTFHGPRALEMAEYLGYEEPQLSLVKSKVLSPWKSHSREVLAYVKWRIDRILGQA
ncbi:YdcF family protein [Paenibacillus sp. P96]|uniref:YdcF family protein n=1 Tax=Paenibacillus zeirhizosphaerae TaxID=2987519 RepID=A0ABT9FP73_9BACL|nr:YdcF family protein [Paenibacillus sp. P96]MDP4096531.1 YdcF family protein [Paenibacillus sp. P96]